MINLQIYKLGTLQNMISIFAQCRDAEITDIKELEKLVQAAINNGVGGRLADARTCVSCGRKMRGNEPVVNGLKIRSCKCGYSEVIG